MSGAAKAADAAGATTAMVPSGAKATSVARAALFVPHAGCPHDCIFCNQRQITGHSGLPTDEEIEKAAAVAAASGRGVRELAFFGGSFTAIRREDMLRLLDAGYACVKRYGLCGIRVSTRPDAVDEEVLSLLKARGVTAVELGAQSMDDRVLALSARGHTSEDTRRAAALVRSAGMSLVLQMMIGLPGEGPEGPMDTARSIAVLRPGGVRVYPVVVLKGTGLHRLLLAGEYRPPELSEAVEVCASLLDFFEKENIPVIRMGLHSDGELSHGDAVIAGPYHPAFRELVEGERVLRRLSHRLCGMDCAGRTLMITVPPRDVSVTVGQHRRNLAALTERYGFAGVRVRGDVSLPSGGLLTEIC